MLSLYRFAAAGAAIRFAACNRESVSGIVSLDIALPRNEMQWFEELPPALDRLIHTKLYYGHFLCHLMHQHYVVKAAEDTEAVKAELLALLEQRGAQYPAEHNYGHLYEAPPNLRTFYAEADPTNTLNPGVGRISSRKHYA